MDKKTVFIKTAKGESEGTNLSSDLKRILSLIDSKSTVDELAKRAPPSLRDGCRDILGELEEGGYIRDKNRPHVEPKITVPKFNPLKMFTPQPAGELDFNTPSAAASVANVAELAAKQKADEAEQLEAAVAAAKVRASAEATAKAEAKARQEAEIEARGRALAEADAAAKAEAKARKDAEIAERARLVAEANAKHEAELRAQAGAKAKQEALARMQAEQEAARNKAALEAAVRVRAEIEAAARAQQVAEAQAKEEAAARLQAQHEAARAKAALEVAARGKAEAEARARAEIEAAARARQEAEEKAKREAEATRLKIEQEAARVKAELEVAAKAKLEAEAALLKAEQEAARIRAELAAAKIRAEAEAKAVAEARAKQEAEAKALAEARARQEAEEKARREAEAARIKAEHEAALIRAEQEAVAKVRAEAEARDRREAEEQARREADAARLKVEHEAALIRAEQEAVARVRAEADAKSRAEEETRAIADALAKQLQEETIAKLEAEELARRAAAISAHEALSRPAPVRAPAAAYEIQLDGFLGGAQPAQNVAPVIPETENAEAESDAEQAAAENSDSETSSLSNVAAEMARLKEESEAARRKLEEEIRRKEEEEALAEEQAKAWAEAEQRAKTQSLQETEQAAQVAQSQTRAQQIPGVRKRRKPLPLGKISFVLVMLALIVAVVLPYVYPLEEYIAPLEQSLSAQMRQPVRIGKLSASSLPPKLTLHSVTLGSAQEVKVAGIVLSFDVFSLLSDVKVIDDAELQDVSIQGALLDKQAASLKLAGANRQYPVRHLTVQRLKIVTDEVALPVFSGIADIDVQGAISRVALHSADDKLGIDLQHDQGRWQLGVNLRESSLFFLPDVVFSDLSAKGVLGDDELNFNEFDAHIYNGMLMGSAKLNWLKGWQLQGHLEAKTFELNKMFPKYGIEGELYGEGAFSFSGGKISQMVEAPTLDGSFSVKKGIINGFDMVETARLLSREHMVGGRTHFDDLIGLVQFDNHVTRFRQVRIVSNMLSSSGTFDVSATNQLGGKFGAEIKMRTGNNALTLFGTLTEPKLRAGN